MKLKKVIEAEITYAGNDSGRKHKSMFQNVKSGFNNEDGPAV